MSSWSDDAVELKNRVFTNPDKVREINHRGNFSLFLDLVLPNQLHKGYLLLFKLVLQKQVRSLLPEMLKLCLSQRFPEELGKQIKAIKTLAKEKYGRPEGSIKFLQLITPVVADTHELAEEKFKELQLYGDLDGAQALFQGGLVLILANMIMRITSLIKAPMLSSHFLVVE